MVYPFKAPVVAPGGEPAVNRPPWWQVVRQQPPGAGRPQDIEEAVDAQAPSPGFWPARLFADTSVCPLSLIFRQIVTNLAKLFWPFDQRSFAALLFFRWHRLVDEPFGCPIGSLGSLLSFCSPKIILRLTRKRPL